MKRLISLLLCLVMCVSLCACAKNEAVSEAEELLDDVDERSPESETAIAAAEEAENASHGEAASVPTDSVKYEIVRWDKSVVKESGHSFNYYYDYLTFDEGTESCALIAADQYSAAEEFMNSVPMRFLEEPLINYDTEISGFKEADTLVTHNGDGILSVLTEERSYTGGNTVHMIKVGRTYSLESGKLLELPDLIDAEPEEILEHMRSLIWEEIRNGIHFDDARETLDEIDFDDFSFWIEDGELIIWVRRFVLTSGADGPICVYTGIRLDEGMSLQKTGSADQMGEGTLTDAGPVEYDYKSIDRSHRIGYEYNTRYFTHYPVLSGDAAGIDAINADLYRIADEFMHEKTQAEIEEPHYAYGIKGYYYHDQYFQATHNGNGIISFVVSINGFWGDMEKMGYSHRYGVTYDLNTGRELTLQQLVDMSEKDLYNTIRAKAAGYFSSRKSPVDATMVPTYIRSGDYGFWIEEGEVIVAFYDDPANPDETEWFGTGIRIF